MADVQYVIFRLEDEYYGADIRNIQEIILPKIPTKVPNNPDFIEGVIDYRNKVIPVLDLKKRFKLGIGEYTKDTKFIVVQLGDKHIAVVVDEVTEIFRTDTDNIGEPPEMTRIGKDYITGVAHLGERLIILLDLAKVLTVDEQLILESL